ncbi:hypothetical protein MMC24_003293 [Lignoscripta atroalba]|nr:hypothetical protein [Lignoscripta atroalba]
MSSANPPQHIISLVREITTAQEESAGDFFNNETARVRALRASKQLSAALEQPEDTAFEMAFLPAYSFCSRVAIDLGLYNIIAEGDNPKSAVELASISGGEQLLIVRIMRVLAAMGFVAEVDEQSYASTPITRAMAVPPLQAGHKHFWDQGVRCMAKLPEFLRKNGYKCPSDPRKGSFQYAFQTDLEAFEYWAQSPDTLDNFNTFMMGNRAARPSWVDWFPVQKQLLDGLERGKDDVLLIDIAGGRGHDLQAFKTNYPQASGRLILQDTPSVIDDIKSLDESIERIKYDFFTPQPVKGARAYFFHFIFHDWADDPSREILRNTASAMKKGYSQILLNELILPDKGCPLFQAGMDLNMMAMHAGMERTQKQWVELLDSAGFEITKFWLAPGDGEGVIEVVLRE